MSSPDVIPGFFPPGILPLADERIDVISIQSDVADFIEAHSHYPLEEDETRLFVAFVRNSRLLEVATKQSVEYGSAAEAQTVGALKHVYAYRSILSMLAGVDDVNALGLPYLMEAEDDLQCALLLLGSCHYKQSVQLLRSALETAVAHAYFSISGVMYDDLPHQRIPSMNGMLDRIVTFGLLGAVQAVTIHALYTELSSATHSQYKYLSVKFEEIHGPDRFLQAIGHVRAVSITCLLVMLNMTRLDAYCALKPSPIFCGVATQTA